MYLPVTPWTWAFMLVAILQAAIVIGLESYVFAKFQQSIIPGLPTISDEKPVPTDLSLFIFGFVYELVLVYDSLRLKNTIQVIGLCVYNFGMLVYASIQVDQVHRAIWQLSAENYVLPGNPVWVEVRPSLIAVPCVIALCTLIFAFLSYKLYGEFAWTIYKHISADLRMRRRFLTFQIYITLLKFDFFFFVGFTVQFLVVVTNVTTVEYGLTIAAIPVTILILLAAAYWTRRENMAGMVCVTVLFVGGLTYFLFKLVRMYEPFYREFYAASRKTMTVFAVIAVILIVTTIANTLACMRNFGRGLRPLVERRRISSDEEKSAIALSGGRMADDTELGVRPDTKYGPAGTGPSRMEID